MTALLQLDGLGIGFGDGDDPTRVVDGVSLCLQAGEVTALVGESGSGKTLVTRAILDLLPPGGRVTDGKILFRQEPLHSATSQRIRALRGAEIGLILQEPLTSLNPSMRIGDQLIESLRWHRDLDERQSRMLAVDMLEKLDIRDPESCMRKYPHEFSGGMRQRILIASVLLLRPSLVIADEPTTALDVLVQKQVLDAMLEIVRESETAVLLITHDLALAARYSDRVAVMQRGSLVECGEVSEILLRPRHEYTRKLLASMPKPRPASTARKSTEPAVVAENVTVRFRGRRQLPWKPAPALDAVDGVSLSVYPGETLVVVGESGSGKSTLARAMLGLLPLETGVVRYDGVDPGRLAGAELRALRRRTQMVFQDPYSSLDPRQTVIEIVAEGLRSADKLSTAQVRERAADILTEVGLGTSFAERYPHELSGGQRQRVNIARALVGQPEFVVADEPVSSLDITVQAEILELFNRLREQRSFSCLFITHDLGVARQVGDRIAVMCRGRIVEQGRPDQIFDSPCHPYTCELLEAAPLLNEEAGPSYGLANQRIERSTLPGGYRVATGAGSRADSDQPPELLELGPEHYVECVRTRSPAEFRNLETES